MAADSIPLDLLWSWNLK